jgi:thioesterase domain-containing protein
MSDLGKELQWVWQAGIPLAGAMGIQVVECAPNRLLIEAPLAPNINVHGTAFAGSLYGVCALAGWGMLWLQLRQRALTGSILLAEAQISYVRPVADTIRCACEFDPALHERQLERLADSGKGVFVLVTQVLGADQAAVRFEGRYAVRV